MLALLKANQTSRTDYNIPEGLCQFAGLVECHKLDITHVLQHFRGLCQFAGLVKCHKSRTGYSISKGFVSLLGLSNATNQTSHTLYRALSVCCARQMPQIRHHILSTTFPGALSVCWAHQMPQTSRTS